MLLFLAGAALGEVQASLLVAGAALGDGCEAGCGLMVSFSDHGRIMLGSSPHWKRRSTSFRTFALKFCSVIFRGRRSIW